MQAISSTRMPAIYRPRCRSSNQLLNTLDNLQAPRVYHCV